MLRLELYPFKFRDRITGRWVRARHKLPVPELQRRYAEWEIIGPPENPARYGRVLRAVQPVQAANAGPRYHHPHAAVHVRRSGNA